MKKITILGIMLSVLLANMLILAFNTEPVGARTIVVPDDYRTIQAAINAAWQGDTVLVKAGTYDENVVVDKMVLLTGENRETTIIDANGTSDVIRVMADKVIIEGFTIRKSDSKAAGIVNEGYSYTTIRNNTIIDNGWGISFTDSLSNLITENNIVNNDEDGILIGESYNNSVSRNYVTNSVYGIWLGGYSDNNMITGNYVTNNEDSGIAIERSSNNNTITGNNLVNNGGGVGIWNSCNNNMITGNNITDSWVGIDFTFSCNNNTITGNNITNNQMGIKLSTSSNNKFHHNNFIDNIQQVDMETSDYTNFWDDGYPSGGNYWSDHNPPDENMDKIGDISYTIDDDNIDEHPLVYPFDYVPNPDVNGDGIIDIFDVVTVATAFGSKPGDQNWNPVTDIDGSTIEDIDEIIDIFDIVTISKDFGKTS